MRVSVSICLALVLVACGPEGPGDSFVECVNDVDNQLRPIEEHLFVAHAGGSPLGLNQSVPYSNSVQAFEASYHNGFRVYEFDMITLADGTVVLAHDFHEEHYGLVEGTFRDLDRADVEGRQYNGEYDVMFAEDLIELMVEYPDIWVILDTKWDHVTIASILVEMSPGPEVTDRMVPHLSGNSHTLALLDVYPFPERMIAMYRWRADDATLLANMQDHDIDNVMMWWDSRWNEDTQEMLVENGYHSWVHTPKEPDVIEDFVARGVGVYTNGYIGPCSDAE